MPNFKSDVALQNENDRPNELQNEVKRLSQVKEEPVDEPDCPEGHTKQFLPTLPRNFKSLVGRPIKIESEQPRDIIESLGDYLGITDYKTNMMSFWFLDILALQFLRRKNDLDEHYASVFVGWLAGEMKLIQDKKLSRSEFFEKMSRIFSIAADKVSEVKELLHWDQIVQREHSEKVEVEQEKENFNESVQSLALKKSKHQNSRRSSLHRRQSKDSKGSIINMSSIPEVGPTDRTPIIEEVPESTSTMDPLPVLDIIIEATYETYANELRYALVYAAFAEPIEMETYHLPFFLRTPRPVKLAKVQESPFNIHLQRKLLKDVTGKKTKDGGRSTKKKADFRVPSTPPPSLSDEEILINKRQFILPLIESNEAPSIFEARAGDAGAT